MYKCLTKYHMYKCLTRYHMYKCLTRYHMYVQMYSPFGQPKTRLKS